MLYKRKLQAKLHTAKHSALKDTSTIFIDIAQNLPSVLVNSSHIEQTAQLAILFFIMFQITGLLAPLKLLNKFSTLYGPYSGLYDY